MFLQYKKSLKKYIETILNIINNDKLGLSDEVKKNKIDSITNLCNSFKDIKEKIKDI